MGDVLLHIIFYAKIASESNFFDIEEVINTICDKLIERHPHIYGNVSVRDEEEVKYNWEKIKLNTGSNGVLAGVPQSLPSLVKAYRIQEKVAGIGFDWKEVRDVRDKIQEEFDELEQELENNNVLKAEKEMGDVFFSLINYARFLKINPDNALSIANEKFINRFSYIENKAKEMDKTIVELSSDQMNILWDEAKKYFP